MGTVFRTGAQPDQIRRKGDWRFYASRENADFTDKLRAVGSVEKQVVGSQRQAGRNVVDTS